MHLQPGRGTNCSPANRRSAVGIGLQRVFMISAGDVSETTRHETLEPGESREAEELFTLVYDALRKLAAVRLAQEAPGQTLQPTALAHEVWLKLAGSNRQQWRDRAHFF